MAQKVIVSVSMDTEADRDLLRWLKQQENQSAAIREGLRNHIGRGGLTLGDVYQAVKDLERKLQNGAALASTAQPEDGDDYHEPPDVAATLDALGSL
jgi:hypothetical protein